MALLVIVIVRDLGDIYLVIAFLPFFLLDVLGLVSCRAVVFDIIGFGIILTHGEVSLFSYLPSSPDLFLFSPSFLGSL